MSSHNFYIACSYLALALGIAWEIWDLRRQRRRVLARERDLLGAEMAEQDPQYEKNGEDGLGVPQRETLG